MTYDEAIRAHERARWVRYLEDRADKMPMDLAAATTLRAAASDMSADLAPEIVDE